MILINDITKTFNKGSLTALDCVSCSIDSNKIVGFIGPDGAGKTTLLRIIAGVLTPDKGEVSINGRSLELSGKSSKAVGENMISQQELHNMIAYMPQKFGLYEDLSIIENLELYGRLQNLSDAECSDSFERVLKITRLADFRKRLAGNLSGGMKQKLGLACALLKRPKILILDEPSVGVDPISRKELISMVNTMLDSATVLWSTAYLDEAEELDHVVLLSNGKVTFEGAPAAAKKRVDGRVFVFSDVRSEKRMFAAELLQKDGIMDATISGKDVRFITSEKALPDKLFSEKNAQKAARISPTFEDACIDILGGMTEKYSPIEQYIDMPQHCENQGEPVVEAVHLTKRFGNFTAVDDVSFSLERGKILGLLGPNGSGKSTTFRMLCGLLWQNSGTARVAGIDVKDMGSEAKMQIGYMAQKFSLYPILSVRQNLDFFSGAYRLSGAERKNAVSSMIEIFHLESLANLNVSVLSLGYKQRLALACAIMHKPMVLFLDEPTSGVDPITRREFWMHINTMVRRGMSVVVTTHFMDEAENCDEIALIYKGKIRAAGAPDDLKLACGGSDNATLEQAFINIVMEVDGQLGQTYDRFLTARADLD